MVSFTLLNKNVMQIRCPVCLSEIPWLYVPDAV
jgi:hypothetical protein